MSMDDSQEEDCTVYIEELKSDNPSLKINAATKLPVIASVLGHNRIRDELIPYLIEIIEQMDNQNQFLIKIAEGLYECKSFCKSQSDSHILIPPLKILASLDQPSVREKAVESILKICEGSSKVFYENHIFPLIVSMSDKKNLYSPRVSASCMITTCYPNVGEANQLQLQKIFKRLGVQQNSPLVRRSVAENLQAYSKAVPKTVTKTDGLEIWQKFITDKIDIVRIKALECAATLARFFKKEEINDKFFKYIKLVDPEKKSWRIRYALIEAIASLIPFLEKELLKKDSVQIFQQLLKDSQAEVRTIALLKLPELTQKLTQQQSYNVFFQYIEKAAKDPSINVKMALVESIVPYLATIEKQKVSDNGITLLMGMIKDQNQIIRTGIVQRLKDLSEVLGDQGTERYLLPMIETSIIDKKWRFKLAVAESIKGLFKGLDPVKNKGFLDKIVKIFVKDHYAAVRQQTIQSLCELKGVLGSQRCMELIGETIKTLVNESNCYYRITGIQSLKNAASVLQKNDFNDVFSSICKKLQSQKVPNVLLAILTIYPKIKGSLTPQSKKDFQALLRKAKQSKDEDVLYFAEKAEE